MANKTEFESKFANKKWCPMTEGWGLFHNNCRMVPADPILQWVAIQGRKITLNGNPASLRVTGLVIHEMW